jgi:hypothetical protein
MDLQNRDGDAVDPVPFLVVTLLAFLLIYAFGPLYLQAFGVTVDQGLAVCTAIFLPMAAAAYYQFIWTHSPERQGIVPAGVRFGRLWYAILILVALFVLLALPFFFR